MKKGMQIFVLLALYVPCYSAEGPEKIAVEIAATAQDEVGRRLVYLLKEGLASSGRLRETFTEEPRLKLVLVSMSNGNSSYATIYSATWLWAYPTNIYPGYLTSSVGSCGSDRVNSCSQTLLADAILQADEILKMRAMWDKAIKDAGISSAKKKPQQTK